MTFAISTTSAGVESGRHIVLVHGSLDRGAGLLKLSRRLDTRYFVTRYDRRGYGKSRPCDGPFGIDAQVDDLVAVIAGVANTNGPAVLVGHSYGGNVALATAERHPDLVVAVVTFESPLSWEPWWPSSSAGTAAAASLENPEDAGELFMRRLIGNARWERLPAATRESRRSEGPVMLAELGDLRVRPAWQPDKIHVPVLAMHGEHGLEHHCEAMRLLGERLPDAQVCLVPGARHFGPNTHADETADLILKFLEERVSFE